MATIDLIVLHCSDSPDEHHVTAEDIHSWHKARGFDGIGYHYVIERDGTISPGRPEYWRGAHARRYNSNSLGICVVGRDVYTPQQIQSLDVLHRRLKKAHPSAIWKGHRELDEYKTCPNDVLMAWLRGVRK